MSVLSIFGGQHSRQTEAQAGVLEAVRELAPCTEGQVLWATRTAGWVSHRVGQSEQVCAALAHLQDAGLIRRTGWRSGYEVWGVA
jgi:hypothetical protein